MESIKDKQSIRSKYLIDLKDYEEGDYISGGTYGYVIKIKNKTTKEEYAAKIIRLIECEYSKLTINREIGIMIRLQHPTLVRFIGYSLKDFEDQECVVIIMEYAKNKSLANFLEKNRKAKPNVLCNNTTRQKILIGISYAMMYLHRNHVIHRDLKPLNVVLDEFYHPHLTDFGASKFNRSGHTLEQTGPIGSAIYMAPEVIRYLSKTTKTAEEEEEEEIKYDEKADVYSFAILMFEVVTDLIPYPKLMKLSSIKFAKKFNADKIRPEFTKPVKETIKQLIIQCWDEDPKKRPTFEEIFNKLAFNLEDSVYDIFEEDDEYKYYLDDVDVDEIFDYVYEITENTSTNPKIERLMRDNEELKRENISIKKEISNHDKIINDLITENEKMKEELEQTKSLLDKAREKMALDNKETKLPKDSLEMKPNAHPNEDEKETKLPKDSLEIKPNAHPNEDEKETKKVKDSLEMKPNAYTNEDEKETSQTKDDIELSVTETKKSDDMLDLVKRETLTIKNKCDKEKLQQFGSVIYVGGCDKYRQFNIEKHNVNENDESFINPPQGVPPLPSHVQSYSIYLFHSVMIGNNKDSPILGFGNNEDGRIYSHFPKQQNNNFIQFSITDSYGNKLIPISAVCCTRSTLYMCSKRSGKGRQLILCNSDINKGQPIFLDIGNQDPVALYGGAWHAAAISSEGKIIIINSNLIEKSPESPIESYALPYGEKASSVAFMDNKCFVLSSSGRVFSSNIAEADEIMFLYVEKLHSESIVHLSGTRSHVLAVTKNGRVFGCGSNVYGQLGLDKRTENVPDFTEIKAIKRTEISAAYAGYNHSLFMARDGSILSCGDNSYGQLLIKNQNRQNSCTPLQTIIKKDATFCIVGKAISVVFVGCYPPIYTPNTKIEFPS